MDKEKPKQETLEEVAERWNDNQTTLEFGKPHNAPNRIKAFIEGAKWQQERSYSEEDMINFAWFLVENLRQFSDDRDAHFKGKYLTMWEKDKKK